MQWVELTVRTTTAGADLVSELLMRAGAKGTIIEDRYDAQTDLDGPAKWDILDEAILEAMDEDVLVRAYLPDDAGTAERIAGLPALLAGLSADRVGFDTGSLALTLENVDEEDWAENWKKYYKPFRVGERLLVKPVWEAIDPAPGDLVIEIDPGMAFGNGTHETTAMCMAQLERVMRPGDRVLDVGTGSGILALAAARLGAAGVLGVDLDPVAVRVAKENIERNGLSDIVEACVGDLLAGVDAVADLVVANIIADVIIVLSGAVRAHMTPGAAFLCSGIIRDREADVLDALAAAGFDIEHIERAGEWVAIVARG